MAAKKEAPSPAPSDPNKELTLPEPANGVPPKPSPSPWTTVTNVMEIADLDRLKVLLYGPNGAGKSTCAARFDRPLIGLTEGQAIPAIKEANPRAIIKLIRSGQELLEFRQLCRSRELAEKCDAIVLDSLTDVQRILKELYTNMQEKRRDVTSMESWGKTIESTARLARELRDLPVHTAVLCLDAEIEIEGEGVVHRPAVSGKALPNQLGQFFNIVGYVSRTTTPSGVRREVMFLGPDRYQTKGMTGLDDIEPPEPMLWISKRWKKPLFDGVDGNGETAEQRIKKWKAHSVTGETATDSVMQQQPTTTTTNNAGTVDPFGA